MWNILRRKPSAEPALADLLRGHVETLAATIGERNVFHPDALEASARFIQRTWEKAGFRVHASAYPVEGVTCRNLEVEVRGATPEIVLLGAHYDSAPGSPGANDNGTGVAALIEVARLLARSKLRRTVRFVAFVNEEPPWFETPQMGSRVYAAAARARGDRITAMLALETIGYFSEAPGSQHFPPGLGLLYPTVGNFLAVVGDVNSQHLVGQITDALIAARQIPVESLAAFANTPGVSWSDHSSFWLHGYPACMLTDTALYRYPHYHTQDDRPEYVRYDKLAAVTRAVVEVARRLADA